MPGTDTLLREVQVVKALPPMRTRLSGKAISASEVQSRKTESFISSIPSFSSMLRRFSQRANAHSSISVKLSGRSMLSAAHA